MTLVNEKLYIAGPPDVIPEDDPLAAFEGCKGAGFLAVSASNGEKLAEIQHLKSPPVYDGLIAAERCLYISTADGCVHCFGEWVNECFTIEVDSFQIASLLKYFVSCFVSCGSLK